MKIAILVPVIVGMATIFQAAINKKIGMKLGVIHATTLTNFFGLVYSLILFYLIKGLNFHKGSFFASNYSLAEFEWSYLIPALFGVVIVIGIPFSIFKIGAVSTTVLMVAAQLITSAFWDARFEGLPITTPKMLAIALALAAVVLVNYSPAPK